MTATKTRRDQEVARLMGAGYRPTVDNDRMTVLRRPKRFSVLAFLASALAFGVGAIVYVGYYLLLKHDRVVTVLADGTVVGEVWTVGGWLRRQDRRLVLGGVALLGVIVLMAVL